MKKKILLILTYLTISFNTYVFSVEDKNENLLKIGVLAPFSGELKDLGEEILYSINIALHDLRNPNIKIFPNDSGSQNEKILDACGKFQNNEIKIVIGPIQSKQINKLSGCGNIIFLSLSNMSSDINKNIIMLGINLESQLLSIKNFIEKKKRNKTLILFPKNNYAKHIEKNISEINFTNSKIFKYDQDPEKLTKQIEKLTNYKQRKINLEARIKKLEGSDQPKDLKELNRLKQKYTLGKINFDSIIILDFGDSLKSVLTSLAYTDVSGEEILIVTSNQWFDQSLLAETSIKNLYFPSINFKNFRIFKENFFKIYKYNPTEISILGYDAIGLIYYAWRKSGEIKSVNDFNFKKSIKGKIGKFNISDNKVIQELNVYNIKDGNFTKYNF
tara:strand:- start:1734 stop:2897 length:1164 start_codon:yes stop_codon:yes gene_type:complete